MDLLRACGGQGRGRGGSQAHHLTKAQSFPGGWTKIIPGRVLMAGNGGSRDWRIQPHPLLPSVQDRAKIGLAPSVELL